MKNPYKTEHPTELDCATYQAYELAREDAIREVEAVKNPYIDKIYWGACEDILDKLKSRE